MEIVKAFNENNLHTNICIKGTHEEPLFRASDIGEVLEISNIRSSTQDFDNTERHVHTVDTSTGPKQVTFLTEKGLYKVLFKSRKPIAEKFQNWVCDVIKELRLSGKYELEKKIKETEQLLEKSECEKQKLIEEQLIIKEYRAKIPVIYIYNTDKNSVGLPMLKIGCSSNIHERIKPYKQTHPYGKLEFTIKVSGNDLKKMESAIHFKLQNYKINSEVFQIDIEEARLIITHECNFLNLLENGNVSERKILLKKCVEHETNVINNTSDYKIVTRDSSTQTDFIDEMKTHVINDNNALVSNFKQFIDESCIIHSKSEVSTKEIEGAYRLWSKNKKNDITKAFKSYLDINFKQCRLRKQDKDQIVHGYVGITLKEIKYVKKIEQSDVQTFLFQVCLFTPSGTILNTSLETEYNKWRINVGKEAIENPNEEIKNYLKDSNYVLYTTVWSNSSSGQGYYGIKLKSEEFIHKTTSSTGKCVEKRDKNTNDLLETWETIAKAAVSENISAAKMSRSIKNKTVFNDEYFYISL
jgi:prophage antirepressor-like protein